MKTVYKIILWVFSVVFLLMALLMLIVSVLSGAMLLGCAVLLNPLFIEHVHLKKGLTALLVIGLIIGSVAVIPTDPVANANQTAESKQEVRQITPEPTATAEVLRLIPTDTSMEQETEKLSETVSASPSPDQCTDADRNADSNSDCDTNAKTNCNAASDGKANTDATTRVESCTSHALGRNHDHRLFGFCQSRSICVHQDSGCAKYGLRLRSGV